MEWGPIVIGICSLLGAFGGITLSQMWGSRRNTKNILFNVYMKLIELHGEYWWESVREFHKEEPNLDRRRRIAGLAWLISDEIRKIDKCDFTASILEVLFSKDTEKYPTTKVRYESIENIIDTLGKYLNRNYSKIMKEISKRNIEIMTSRYKNGLPTGEIRDNDPGSFV